MVLNSRDQKQQQSSRQMLSINRPNTPALDQRSGAGSIVFSTRSWGRTKHWRRRDWLSCAHNAAWSMALHRLAYERWKRWANGDAESVAPGMVKSLKP